MSWDISDIKYYDPSVDAWVNQAPITGRTPVGISLTAVAPEVVSWGNYLHLISFYWKDSSGITHEIPIVESDIDWDDSVSQTQVTVMAVTDIIPGNIGSVYCLVSIWSLYNALYPDVRVTKTVAEYVSPCSPSFSYSPVDGYAPLTVEFTNTSEIGETVTAHRWEFGDGDTSSQANPEHTYENPGQYTVLITETTSKGKTRAKTPVGILVISPPLNLIFADAYFPEVTYIGEPFKVTIDVENTGYEGSLYLRYKVKGNTYYITDHSTITSFGSLKFEVEQTIEEWLGYTPTDSEWATFTFEVGPVDEDPTASWSPTAYAIISSSEDDNGDSGEDSDGDSGDGGEDSDGGSSGIITEMDIASYWPYGLAFLGIIVLGRAYNVIRRR